MKDTMHYLSLKVLPNIARDIMVQRIISGQKAFSNVLKAANSSKLVQIDFGDAPQERLPDNVMVFEKVNF